MYKLVLAAAVALVAVGAASAQIATCDQYCAAMQGNCTGANNQYPNGTNFAQFSMMACQAACFTFPNGTMPTGDTNACRFAMAGMVATNPMMCAVAGPTGGGQCGTFINVFCRYLAMVPGCTAQVATCATTFGNYSTTSTAQTGMTFACLFGQLSLNNMATTCTAFTNGVCQMTSTAAANTTVGGTTTRAATSSNSSVMTGDATSMTASAVTLFAVVAALLF